MSIKKYNLLQPGNITCNISTAFKTNIQTPSKIVSMFCDDCGSSDISHFHGYACDSFFCRNCKKDNILKITLYKEKMILCIHRYGVDQ